MTLVAMTLLMLVAGFVGVIYGPRTDTAEPGAPSAHLRELN